MEKLATRGRPREFDKEEALAVALRLFWQKGYESTSLTDLTEAMGITRPSLYAAFGNKEALFHKALDRYDAIYMDFMRSALHEPTSRAVVKRLLEGSAELQTRNDNHRGCLGINGALACSAEAEPIRQELNRRRKASEAALLSRLEQARMEGDLPQSADCAALSAYVMAVSQGMAVQAKGGAPKARLDSIVEHVVAHWP